MVDVVAEDRAEHVVAHGRSPEQQQVIEVEESASALAFDECSQDGRDVLRVGCAPRGDTGSTSETVRAALTARL